MLKIQKQKDLNNQKETPRTIIICQPMKLFQEDKSDAFHFEPQDSIVVFLVEVNFIVVVLRERRKLNQRVFL